MVEETQPLGFDGWVPTVVRQDGLRVLVRSHDHRPPHVHVEGPGWELRVLLGRQAVLGEVLHGAPSNREVRRAVDLVGEHLSICVAKWEELHGEAP